MDGEGLGEAELAKESVENWEAVTLGVPGRGVREDRAVVDWEGAGEGDPSPLTAPVKNTSESRVVTDPE